MFVFCKMNMFLSSRFLNLIIGSMGLFVCRWVGGQVVGGPLVGGGWWVGA